jgi:FMN-dependent NADH-azoreductase
MKKLFHIIASPRGEASRTLKVSVAFLSAFKETHRDWVVDELDLFRETIPALTARRVDGKYVLLGGKELFGELKESWEEIIQQIDRFRSADAYLLSTPMWNFGIPYPLKQYIDIILQPKYLFRYTETGSVEGLIKGRKMFVAASRGGDYSTPETKAFDHQEPYLRTAFGFVGLTDVTFVIAQPMDAGTPELQQRRLAEAIHQARELAMSF